MTFKEGKFLVKTLGTQGELEQAYRIRHTVFAEQLAWVPRVPLCLDTDKYDAWSTSIGVFDDACMVATMRITQAPAQFMLESEFGQALLGGHEVRKVPDTFEISRFAVDPTMKTAGLSFSLFMILLKGIYQWGRLHDSFMVYFVVEHRLLRAIQRLKIPAQAIAEAVLIPPANVRTVAAVLDLDELREKADEVRPGLVAWFDTLST